jgi:hypothetical protein
MGVIGPTGNTGPTGPAGGPTGPTGPAPVNVATVGYTIDGNGTVIVTGIAGSGIRVPFAGTINSVTLLADISGSIKVDILKDTYSNYIFTSGSICASALPALSSAVKYEDTTLTGWTTSFSAGDVFRFKVDSSVVPAGVTNVAIILKVTKS